jgi:hypothetical protein
VKRLAIGAAAVAAIAIGSACNDSPVITGHWNYDTFVQVHAVGADDGSGTTQFRAVATCKDGTVQYGVWMSTPNGASADSFANCLISAGHIGVASYGWQRR